MSRCSIYVTGLTRKVCVGLSILCEQGLRIWQAPHPEEFHKSRILLAHAHLMKDLSLATREADSAIRIL